jgi:ribosome biogenesis protein Tsr3
VNRSRKANWGHSWLDLNKENLTADLLRQKKFSTIERLSGQALKTMARA